MQKHPIIEQLIEAQLDFLDQEFNQSEMVQTEFVQFYQSVSQTKLTRFMDI